MPFSFSSSAVTPSPSVSVPENVPSYTRPQPQEGLFSFSTAAVQPYSRARRSVSSAPRRYSDQ